MHCSTPPPRLPPPPPTSASPPPTLPASIARGVATCWRQLGSWASAAIFCSRKASTSMRLLGSLPTRAPSSGTRGGSPIQKRGMKKKDRFHDQQQSNTLAVELEVADEEFALEALRRYE